MREVITNSLFTFMSCSKDMAYMATMVPCLKARIIACSFQSLSNNSKGYRNLQQNWIDSISNK